VPDRWQELAKKSRKSETLVVNLYGGPGTGKSTTAARVFAALKESGYTAELVTEFAKDLVWEGRSETLQDQVYILGKQSHRINRLLGKVDVIVTDSPLLLTYVYARNIKPIPALALCTLAKSIYDEHRNLDFYLVRNEDYHPYDTRGRYQSLSGAREVDRQVRKYVLTHVNGFTELKMDELTSDHIVLSVEGALAQAN